MERIYYSNDPEKKPPTVIILRIHRPISLTTSIAKLAEKLISIKLKKFLHENHIIIKQQSGFRSLSQTEDNIFFITQKILEQFIRRKKVCGLFFDIASAFDKVWRLGLNSKFIDIKAPNYVIHCVKNSWKIARSA